MALKLAPKAQVLEGLGIKGHFESFESFESQKWRFQDFSRGISTTDAILFRQNTRNTWNSAIEMSQAFHDIARFERITDPNLFKYAFNVIQNWNTDALQFYSMVLIFC